MGTRSLTYVYDDNEPAVCMYRQFDGYPTGHGKELAEFLNTIKSYNGMGCLAASMVAHFKKESLNFYLHAPRLGQDCWQEYEYHVYDDKVIVYTDYINNQVLFSGTWKELEKYCSSEKYAEDELNMPAFDTPSGRDWLKSLLRDQKVTVTFEKNDGTERVMNCTLNENLIPISTATTKAVVKKREPNPDVLAVWDIESDGWRSFRFDSIKKVEATL